MMYLFGVVVVVVIIAAIMVKLWKSYYRARHEPLMSDEEYAQLDAQLGELGATQSIRVRNLFDGEVLWADGAQEHWRWGWEAGKSGEQAYMRMLVTFIGGLGQGIVLDRGGREGSADQSPTAKMVRASVVVVEPDILPAHFLCRARDEERLYAFLTGTRRKHIHVLDSRVSSFYFDDRRLYVQREQISGGDEMEVLVGEIHAFVQDVLAWSQTQGTIPALQTGQYQGALADMEQSTIRDTSVLEEQEARGERKQEANEELPEAPS